MPQLLICVCFHFSKSKLPHLKLVLQNHIEKYEDSKIILDTNSSKTIDALGDLSSKVQIVIHSDLKHPFHLAWMHRKHIKREINNFDVFMYIEDDIFLPYENYKNYLDVFDLMWPQFIPSFIRTEEKEGWLYCADAFIKTRIRRNQIIQLGSKKFISLDNPYHAFWVMPRWALIESMNENFDRIYDGNKWIREIAASYGLMPGKRDCVRWGSYDVQKLGLVEIDEKMRVSPLCQVKHTTNKYINDMKFNFGKIRIDKIIKKDAILI